jgi:hypothetical protein
MYFVKIITFSNLLTSTTMSNNPGAGFEAYVFPQWSTILGWCIFVACIIPIPLVYIVNYFREYFALRRTKSVSFSFFILIKNLIQIK